MTGADQIVAFLRKAASDSMTNHYDNNLSRAADELERFRSALERIAKHPKGPSMHSRLSEIAKEALRG